MERAPTSQHPRPQRRRPSSLFRNVTERNDSHKTVLEISTQRSEDMALRVTVAETGKDGSLALGQEMSSGPCEALAGFDLAPRHLSSTVCDPFLLRPRLATTCLRDSFVPSRTPPHSHQHDPLQCKRGRSFPFPEPRVAPHSRRMRRGPAPMTRPHLLSRLCHVSTSVLVTSSHLWSPGRSPEWLPTNAFSTCAFPAWNSPLPVL